MVFIKVEQITLNNLTKKNKIFDGVIFKEKHFSFVPWHLGLKNKRHFFLPVGSQSYRYQPRVSAHMTRPPDYAVPLHIFTQGMSR